MTERAASYKHRADEDGLDVKNGSSHVKGVTRQAKTIAGVAKYSALSGPVSSTSQRP